jgi:hypothetical protein
LKGFEIMPKLAIRKPEPYFANQRLAMPRHAPDVAEFGAGFRRNARGNLVRQWFELSLTVFRQPKRTGEFHWCISGPNGRRFSTDGFGDEEDALQSLAVYVGVEPPLPE